MKARVRAFLISITLLPVLSCGSAFAQAEANKLQARRQVAVTFDDLPATQSNSTAMRYVTANLLRSIKANKVPAIGFVNESKLYEGEEVVAERVSLLRMWLTSGLDLGNHTFSHVSIDQTPLAAYEENVVRGEIVTNRLLSEQGMKLRYFRHPQLRTGPTLEYKKALESFLAQRGYTIAPVTIDNNDFIFADVYAKAKQRGNRELMKRIADAYIPYLEQIFAFFEQLSVDSLGYEVKQTLLLHANELNADHFDELAGMMRRRGYSFISLEEALQDKAYSLPDGQAMKGLSWLHRWMLARGEKMRPEPQQPEFITQLYYEYR